MSNINRVPKGVPAGGQFSEGRKAEADMSTLTARPSLDRRRTAADVIVTDDGKAHILDLYGQPVTLCRDDGSANWRVEDFTPEASDEADRAVSRASMRLWSQPYPDGTLAGAAQVVNDTSVPADVRAEARAMLGDDPVPVLDEGVTQPLRDRRQAETLLKAYGIDSDLYQKGRGTRAVYDSHIDTLLQAGRLDASHTEEMRDICDRGRWHTAVETAAENGDADEVIRLTGVDSDSETAVQMRDLVAVIDSKNRTAKRWWDQGGKEPISKEDRAYLKAEHGNVLKRMLSKRHSSIWFLRKAADRQRAAVRHLADKHTENPSIPFDPRR